MEDYKKKYEDALNAARRFKNDCPSLWDTESNPFRNVFEELKEESKDERLRKEIICYLNKQIALSDFGGDIASFEEWIAWLEKQDPKKHEEELEKAYKCADEVQYRKGYEDAKREIENQNEQKPTDKIEPKFKAGDWVVHKETGMTHQIQQCVEMANAHTYGYDLTDGGYISIFKTDEYHLWTIKDAKDGDVLVNENGIPFIFNGFLEKITVGAHCGITGGIFCIPKEKNIWATRNVLPATKEQRDLLFSKMKEAGYEWDAEKKELKKIEQKPACKLDNLYVHVIFPFKAKVKSSGTIVTIHNGELSSDGKEWIKYQSDSEDGFKVYEPNNLELVCDIKQKSAWSEEDERIYNVVLELVNSWSKGTIVGCIIPPNTDRYINWLKSLKQRMKGE